MKNYTEDPQLRSLLEVVCDPKNKLKDKNGNLTIPFEQGALHRDKIFVHPIEDSLVDKEIYFAFIKASKLFISSAYQRFICVSTIKKAQRFNYRLCQTLVIALRPDGKYVIIDGQHKAIMAYLSGEDLDLPCQIIVHNTNASLPQCIKIEAELFQDLNTSRRNTSKLDKVRAGLSYGDEECIKFQENFEYVGVHAEGIGYVDGPEVKGWAKVAESIDKWKKINTKKAVDYLSPIYANKWHIGYIDGSMVGALAGIFNLLDVCGDGKKYSGLKEYLKTYFTKIGRSNWIKNTRGQSDVLIARRIVFKYNDLVSSGVIDGSTIGEELLFGNKLKDPTKVFETLKKDDDE